MELHHSMPSEWVAAMRGLANRGIKETGTSEDVPRTAAINCRRRSTESRADDVALNSDGLPNPVTEFAVTFGEYPAERRTNKAMPAEKHDKRTSLRNMQILPTSST
jgi:Mg-chelatase subunit ChlI